MKMGAVSVGIDQWAAEVFSPEGFPRDKDTFFIPCHVILLGNAIHFFQNPVMDELAKACEEDGTYEFGFIFTHPKLKGTVQALAASSLTRTKVSSMAAR